MNRRYAIYLGVIALLALANIARWVWYSSNGAPASGDKAFQPEDFRLRVDIPDEGVQGRNLFLAQGGVSRGEARGGTPVRLTARATPAAMKIAAPEPAAPESGIGKFRLLGVVFHGGKGQAYLALDKENSIASSGDTVFGLYVVEKITVDAVELRDLKSNATRKIPVSGK